MEIWRDRAMEGYMEGWDGRMDEQRDGKRQGWREWMEAGMKGWSTEYRISVNIFM